MIHLVWRSLSRVAPSLAAVGFVVAAFQVGLVAAATVIVGGGGMSTIAQLVPSFLQGSLGIALLSFSGIATIGFFHAGVVMIVVFFAIYLASEPAGDVESGVIDLVLSRPLPRHWLITRTALVTVASIGGLTMLMGSALYLGLMLLETPRPSWPSGRVLVLLAAHLTTVASCFGAWSLAASGWARRRGSAVAIVGVAAMALYLTDFLASIWTPIAEFARVSPFHYFHGGEIVAGTSSPARDLGTLAAMTAAGIATAYLRFRKRDL